MGVERLTRRKKTKAGDCELRSRCLFFFFFFLFGMEMNNNKKQSYKENPVSPNRHQRTATLTSSGLGTLSTIIVSAMIFRAVYYRVLVATALSGCDGY